MSRLLFTALTLLVAASCGTAAPTASPTATSTASQTVAPAAAPTAAPTSAPGPTQTPTPAAALDCSFLLTAAEIKTATGRTSGTGIEGDDRLGIPGTRACGYPLEGGEELILSVYRGDDAWLVSADASSAMTGAQPVILGEEFVVANYGLPPYVGADAIAFSIDGIAVLLYNKSSSSLGLDAMTTLAETVLERLSS